MSVPQLHLHRTVESSKFLFISVRFSKYSTDFLQQLVLTLFESEFAFSKVFIRTIESSSSLIAISSLDSRNLPRLVYNWITTFTGDMHDIYVKILTHLLCLTVQLQYLYLYITLKSSCFCINTVIYCTSEQYSSELVPLI